jgi:hypothetical protein
VTALERGVKIIVVVPVPVLPLTEHYAIKV